MTWVTLDRTPTPERRSRHDDTRTACGPPGPRPVTRRAAPGGRAAGQLALGDPSADGRVRDELLGEKAGSQDGWLAARGGAAFRERNALLSRLSALSAQVLETPDVEATRMELKRLVVDVNRHMQRLNDIAYDEVEMEIGGSE